MMRPMIARSRITPNLLIDAQGKFLRVRGLDKVLAGMKKESEQALAKDPKEKARALRTLENASFRAALEHSIGAFWNSWVGQWVGWDLDPGEEIQKRTKVAIGDVQVPAVVTLHHHGAVKGKPGYVRLTAHTLAAGPRMRKAWHAYMRKLVGAPMARGEQRFPADGMVDARLEIHAEVITRLATLRPISAVQSRKVTLLMEGEEKARVQTEKRTYSFDWK